MIARVCSVIESILFFPVLILDDSVIVVLDFAPFSFLVVKGFQNTVCPIRIIFPEPLRLGPLLHFFMLGMRFVAIDRQEFIETIYAADIFWRCCFSTVQQGRVTEIIIVHDVFECDCKMPITPKVIEVMNYFVRFQIFIDFQSGRFADFDLQAFLMKLLKFKMGWRRFFQPLRVERFVFLEVLMFQIGLLIVRDGQIFFGQIETEQMVTVMRIAALEIRHRLDHVMQTVERRICRHDHPAPK